MDQRFYDLIEASPVIAAVKDEQGLEQCLELKEIRVVFLLFGDICNIKDLVLKIHNAKKLAMVHVDLISGLSSKEIAVDFIKQNTAADGVISTKPTIIKRAKETGLYTIMRFFILDSLAFENIHKQLSSVNPDFIEILPGVMPKIISKVVKKVKQPVIAGGLITDKEDVMMALDAGAISVSSTNRNVWRM